MTAKGNSESRTVKFYLRANVISWVPVEIYEHFGADSQTKSDISLRAPEKL